MGLFISFIAVFVVLFLLVAMALAEWTNRDVVELMTSWIPGLRASSRKAPVTAVRLATVGSAPAASTGVKARKTLRGSGVPAQPKAGALAKPRSGPKKSKTKTTTSRTRKTK